MKVRPTRVLELLGVTVVYFAAAWLGLRMAVIARQVSVVWPATGVALVPLIVRGRRLWPGILLGALAANWLSGTSLLASSGIAVGNTLEALIGAALLGRVGFQPSMRRLHDVASLFLLAACLSTIVSATIGVTTLCATGAASWDNFSPLWSTWWIGDATGDLVVAPFLFVWVDPARRVVKLRQLGEAAVLGCAMLLVSIAVFVDRGNRVPYPVQYLIFPAIIWAAVRLGQRATATLVFGALLVTILATLQGRGPFASPVGIETSLLEVSLFMAVVAVTGLFLGAATAERNLAERRRAADYARLRLSEERLARQADELATADRRKDEFLAMLGHELRNPLAPLQNGLQLLTLRSNDQALMARTRGLMERQLRHLVRLVDDLLDVARIRSGKIVLELERVEIAGMVASALDLARPLIETRRHTLEVSLPQQPLWVEADRIRLPQLLANLLNNAAKYTTEGGHIKLAVAAEDGQVVVRIRDTGIGMTAEELSQVFELFAQASSPEHASQGGLGVGLSLARSIAELHRGVLTAHSEGLGKGSEFVLQLPVTTSPLRAARAATGAEAPAVRRILVVDDNVDAAESLGALLQVSGHDVRVVHGGHAALEAAREFGPEVMILDLAMPDMDGYSVARAVRSDPALTSTRLIALSGYGQPEDRRRTREVGFDHHLVKPVENDVLAAAIEIRA